MIKVVTLLKKSEKIRMLYEKFELRVTLLWDCKIMIIQLRDRLRDRLIDWGIVIVKLRNYEIAKLWNCEIVKFWNCEIVKSWTKNKKKNKIILEQFLFILKHLK
jgi:hypothetical protein